MLNGGVSIIIIYLFFRTSSASGVETPFDLFDDQRCSAPDAVECLAV